MFPELIVYRFLKIKMSSQINSLLAATQKRDLADFFAIHTSHEIKWLFFAGHSQREFSFSRSILIGALLFNGISLNEGH